MLRFEAKNFIAFALFSVAGLACSATSQDLGNSDPAANVPPSTEPPASSTPPPADTSTPPPKTSPPATPAGPAFVAGLPFHLVSSNFADIVGLWGSGASDIWAVGEANGIAHYDGAQWSFFQKPSTSIGSGGYVLGAVWGTGPASAWAVGSVSGAGIDKAQLLRWTGSDWVEPAQKLNAYGEYYILNGVWAAADDDVWVAGCTGAGLGPAPPSGQGFAAHLHDGAWAKVAPDFVGNYFSIWGSDATHVWIGGKDRILAYNGTTFTPVSTGLSSTITAITGTSADDVWAFGTSGLARHWNGTTWTTTPIGAPISFMGAFARAPNDVFAVGQLPGVGSAVAHWDGTTWTRGSVSDGAGLRAVWGGANEIWAMGIGVVYRGKAPGAP